MLQDISLHWMDDPGFIIAIIVNSTKPLELDFSWKLLKNVKYIHKAIGESLYSLRDFFSLTQCSSYCFSQEKCVTAVGGNSN